MKYIIWDTFVTLSVSFWLQFNYNSITVTIFILLIFEDNILDELYFIMKLLIWHIYTIIDYY